MGHIHLATLPGTRRWREVVGLLDDRAGADEVVAASAFAAEQRPRPRREGPDAGGRRPPAGSDPSGGPRRRLRRRAAAAGHRGAGCADAGRPHRRRRLGTRARAAGRSADRLRRDRATGAGRHPVDADRRCAAGPVRSRCPRRAARGCRSSVDPMPSREQPGPSSAVCSRTRSATGSTGPSRPRSAPGAASSPSATATRSTVRWSSTASEATRIIREFSGAWYGKTLFREGTISRDRAAAFSAVALKKIGGRASAQADRPCLGSS